MFFKAIAFKEDCYTAENIAIGLEIIMKETDIDKFSIIITDNTSNIKVA